MTPKHKDSPNSTLDWVQSDTPVPGYKASTKYPGWHWRKKAGSTGSPTTPATEQEVPIAVPNWPTTEQPPSTLTPLDTYVVHDADGETVELVKRYVYVVQEQEQPEPEADPVEVSSPLPLDTTPIHIFPDGCVLYSCLYDALHLKEKDYRRKDNWYVVIDAPGQTPQPLCLNTLRDMIRAIGKQDRDTWVRVSFNEHGMRWEYPPSRSFFKWQPIIEPTEHIIRLSFTREIA